MAKINANTNKIIKAPRIPIALRTNAIYKWRNRVKPLSNTNSGRANPSLLFKLRKNSNVSVVTVAASYSLFRQGVLKNANFTGTFFLFNYKRHQLGNSNQG